MIRDDTLLVQRISLLRWVIPLLVSVVGISYMLFEHYMIDGELIPAPYAIVGFVFIGLVGPLFAWVTLAWASKAAIENARLLRETRQQFQVMRVLHEISLDVTSTLESQQVLSAILDRATRLLNAQASSLCVYEAPTGLIREIAVNNLPPEFKGITVRLSEGVIGQVVSTGAPLIVNDYPHWQGRNPVFEAMPFDAVVSAPLRWHGEVFGALCVADCVERRRFDDADVKLLTLFADLASIAFKNAELHAQVVELGETLEKSVEARTKELEQTQTELAHKAEELQKLLAVTVHVQEEERARIARDLHDGSNQWLTGTMYELQAARESLLNGHGAVAVEKLDKAKGLLRRIDEENRRIIVDMRPPVLDVEGLVPALKWQANGFREQCHIACSLRVDGPPIRLAPAAEIAIYRIVQESLNNVSAHAQADHVLIQISFQPNEVCVSIEDNGIGFDPEKVQATAPGRMGLIGMRERAQSINGHVAVESLPEHGTRVRLAVPLARESAGADVGAVN